MISLRPRREKLNGIRKTITSRIWIESTECRRSSSGKYSQESQRWASSRRFKNYWQINSVNLSTSKTGSSSCQSLTTPCGMEKETQNNVRSLVFLVAWIARKMVGNLHLQTRWILGSKGRTNVGKFLSIRSSNISCLQCLCTRRITKQRREKEVNTLQWSHWNHRVASPHSDFCESAQLRGNVKQDEKKFKIRRSVEFSSEAAKMHTLAGWWIE